jgi:xylulose-5-phosphate/fructose-6-phosphate phosphoketolase
VPTIETLAAVDLPLQHFPDMKIRVADVVDPMTLQTSGEHPHGIPDNEFDSMFTTDKPVFFAYHGYPTLIHRLTYGRKNHVNLHVHGYKRDRLVEHEQYIYKRGDDLPEIRDWKWPY